MSPQRHGAARGRPALHGRHKLPARGGNMSRRNYDIHSCLRLLDGHKRAIWLIKEKAGSHQPASLEQTAFSYQNDTVADTLKVRGAPGMTKPSAKSPIQYFLSATFSTLALKRTGVLPNLVL